MKISILGAGSFGTALAHVCTDVAKEVVLWSRNPKWVDHINSSHHHLGRFPGLALSKKIRATTSLEETLSGVQLVLLALPMNALSEVMRGIEPWLPGDAIIVSTTKGIDVNTGEFPSQIIQKILPKCEKNIVVLSGPNFAAEIVENKPWASVVASVVADSARHVQKIFQPIKTLRLYHSVDVVGVELGGAIKNVYAIAAGVVDGLSLGCNARAAMVTRALNEMTRFGMALGAQEKTVYGVSGLGDLLLSCTSAQSRNWRLGNGLSQGKSKDEIERELGEVVEGVGTAKAAHQLMKRHGIDAPICQGVYSVLYEGQGVQEAIDGLMLRVAGEE